MRRITNVLLALLVVGTACGGAGGPTAHQQLFAVSEAQCGSGPFGAVGIGDEVLFWADMG